MYLLDTNIVSETRRQRPHGGVKAWIASVDPLDLYVPAPAIGEIQRGIELLSSKDPARAASLTEWLEQVISGSQLVILDHQVFKVWARIIKPENNHRFIDSLIAATAKAHGFIVATRDVADFERFGVEIYNPFL